MITSYKNFIKNKDNIKKIIIAICAIIASTFFFKFMVYDGFLTCKPLKYCGTIFARILNYEDKKRIKYMDNFYEMIPIGMPEQDLLAMLKKQGIEVYYGDFYYDYPEKYDPVEAFRANYYKTYIYPPDYVIGARVQYLCLFGGFYPGFAIWVKDGKVYKATFNVDRDFI